MAENAQKVVAAPGRPFTLGMLYDARKDTLVQGSTLWDSESLQKMTRRRPQPYSHFKITASDSIKEKSTLLEVDASLRASVACGFVEGEGSAKYLHSQREFMNQCRITLQYKANTHFEQLSLTSEDCELLKDNEMIEKGLATHVVTGIEYGAHAFFVFDSEKLEAREVQEFRLKIQVVIHLLLWSIHFDYNRDLTEEQKSLVKRLSVKFYGDFLLPRNPATFQEAVQTYIDLTKLLENGKNAVPVRVWMIPLKVFNPKAAQLIKRISVGLVIEAEDTVDDLADFQRRCNDSLTDSTVGTFPHLQQQLSTFQKHCNCYTQELKRKMAELCPAIREGKEESALRSLFNDRDTSPFNHEKLSKWLDDKEREINVIQSCLDRMKRIPVRSTQAEVDRFVMMPENSDCWGYIFTSVGNSDPFLDEMGQFLDALKLGKLYEQLLKASAEPWFYSDEIVAGMRKMADDFNGAKESKSVFIAALHSDKYTGAAELEYQNGREVKHLQIHTDTQETRFGASPLSLTQRPVNALSTVNKGILFV